MAWYNIAFGGLPITVHLAEDQRFLWTRIIGVQCGSWFVGAIQGTAATVQMGAMPNVPHAEPGRARG